MANESMVPGGSGRVVVRETIDGVPVEEAAGRQRARQKPQPGRQVAARRPDTYIWGIYLSLLLISVIELFSASSTEVRASNVYAPLIRHCVFLGGGLLIVLTFQKIHYSVFRKLAWPMAILSLALLLLSSVAGVEINGAQRAIQMGPITIQPPEIVKLTVVLLLAGVLARNQIPGGVSMKGIATASVIVMVFSIFVLPNGLTNLLILIGASGCMFMISGMKIRTIFLVLAIYCLCGGLAYALRSASAADRQFDAIAAQATGGAESSAAPSIGREHTQKNRIARHLKGVSPTDTIDDLNRQVFFSKFALANGGVHGRGPGNSRESARLPLAFSDYIYSIIVEDTGFIGGLGLLLLYLCLIGRAGIVASKCTRAFPALLIMGCALLIVLQALVHMAIVTGLAPVSGQPLPFISKGGTSILVMSAAIGMMLSVSRYGTTRGNKKQQNAEISQLPDDLQAANPLQIGS